MIQEQQALDVGLERLVQFNELRKDIEKLVLPYKRTFAGTVAIEIYSRVNNYVWNSKNRHASTVTVVQDQVPLETLSVLPANMEPSAYAHSGTISSTEENLLLKERVSIDFVPEKW